MLARREPEQRVIQMARAPENDTWIEYKNTHLAVPDEGYFQRYVGALWRNRRLALAVFGAVLFLAVAYLLVAPRVYEADVRVLIEPDTPNVVTFKQVIGEDASKIEYYQTQLEILRSRTLARKTIDTLDMWTDPEVAPLPGSVGSLLRAVRAMPAKVVYAVNDLIGNRPDAVAPQPGAEETAAQTRAIDEFLSRLVLNYRPDNRILEVGYRSRSAHHAADVANAIARNYIDQSKEVKFKAAKDASDWLNARIGEQRQMVQDSETAAQQYRAQNGDVAISAEQNTVLQALSDLNSAVTKAKTERLDAEATYRQLQDIERDPAALGSLPQVLSDPFIQKLKMSLADLQAQEVSMAAKLGDKNPELVTLRSGIKDVQERIQAEIRKIADSVGNQYRAALDKERRLTAALEAQKGLALTQDRRAVQYNELQREATSNRTIFEALLQRAKETGISSELNTSNIRIVDPAEVPLRPASPQKVPILLFALVLGIPLAGAAAIGLEFVDDRVRTPDEIKDVLGLKFLGFAPAVDADQFTAYGPLVNGQVPPLFTEALRTVRANVFLAAASAPGPKVLLVTSTGPNEGKTVVASNLAVAIAQSGRRVLLIDADMRLSKVHEVFGVSMGLGLSNVLEGTMTTPNVIQSSGVHGLSLITAGETRNIPGDLLEAERFQNVIAAIEQEYDWIVVDSPPVMAVSDAVAMVPAAAGVVFVVGAQMTRRRAAEAALEQLDAAHAKIFGAVLSRANVLEHSPYYNSSYVRYHNYHAAR